MVEQQKPNKPLFSKHYLEHRIQEYPEWEVDVAEGFEALKKLYQSKQNLLPTLNEAQTEEAFIKPALDSLGFSYIPQVITRGKGRIEYYNYALFNQETDRDAAYPLQTNETAFDRRVIAIASAKYWERPLSQVSNNDQRDINKNTNPSFQIVSDLTGTKVDWGILTNGREWRLYYRQASSTATEFYQVDLVELLEAENLQQFKYFWLFFTQEAFVKNPQGRNFLERVREGSTIYATRVGNELKALVFDRVFPNLAGGFVADATRRGKQVTSEQIYEATLSFLYKLLFLLYAEARNLLPIEGDYRKYSLIQLTQEVAQSIEHQNKLSQTSTKMYDRLLNLFKIIDQGDCGLGVSRYNGGLFHFNLSQQDDQIKYRANHFLAQFKLSDGVLAPVLDQLAQFEGQPIDYSFLGVRQLGSIYEGLLEYRVVIDLVGTSSLEVSVHLENDKGERKATGSYYTPDSIVKYIVSHTLKPILEQRSQRFSELMAEISELQNQFQNNGLEKKLKQLQRQAKSTLLDIKVCDPAMGSGHFLVEAVDYLTDELIHILTQYPEQNPILEMLEQTRQSILQNLEQQRIPINPEHLEPTQLLQQVVMKRCIYGVDLDPMAVELAKVSLWLHSFTMGAPLSFLDHHLRCGNSLIGTTAREVEAKITAAETGQLNLLTRGLLKVAEIMGGVSVLSDATFAEVEMLFRSFDEAAKPFKRLLDIYVSQFFGLKQAENFLSVYGTNAITVNPKKMSKADQAVYEEAQKLSDEKRFFHWDLEFPEVFIDLENASWKQNPGFDAVIGNPPYDVLAEKERKENLGSLMKYLISNPVFMNSRGGKIDLFRLFICRSDHLISPFGLIGLIIPMSFLADQQAISLRKFLLHNNKIRQVNAFPQKDDPNQRIFREAKLPTCIIILSNCLSSLPIQVTVHPGNLLEEISGSFSFTLTEIEALDEDNLPIPLISSNEEVKVLRRFISKNIQKMKNICTTYQGEINETTMDDLISTNPNSGSRILRGGNVQRYQFIPEPKQGSEKYLNVTAYYQKVAGERSAHTVQPRIGYQRNAALDSWKRLIFAPLPTPSYCFDSISYFLIENNNQALALLALLNSRLLEWRFRLTSTNNHVSTSEIAALPIPIFTFTTPPEHRQKSLENAMALAAPLRIALYNQYQINGNLDPILSQVNHHLSQQPEEADIIHDLLAYLAEQMIELNKQKQTEINSFLHWLEPLIGCPIDTLTNKSKIQNYLGDYYKNEPYLSFDELIEVLKKNKKKLKIDPVARKEQQTLKQEYQVSLDTLLPLKMQLIRCDKIIDAIVYRLYGLTEAEIAIVENK